MFYISELDDNGDYRSRNVAKWQWNKQGQDRQKQKDSAGEAPLVKTMGQRGRTVFFKMLQGRNSVTV